MAGLASLNELKTYLRIPTAETSLDAVFQPIIDAATASWEQVTNRKAAYAAYVLEPYSSGMTNELALRNRPVDTAVTFQVQRINQWGQVSIMDPTDYLVDSDAGIITLVGALRFAPDPNQTLVTYSAGYKTTGTGADVKLSSTADLNDSALDWVAAKYRGRIGAITRADVDVIVESVEKVWKAYANLW